MRTRTASQTTLPFAYVGLSGLLVAGFLYMFLAGQAVHDVIELHRALHLETVLSLELMFSAGHVVVYGALTVMLCHPKRSVYTWMTIVVWLGILGIGVEFLQDMGGTRSYGLGDIVANFTGICLALTYRFMSRRRLGV